MKKMNSKIVLSCIFISIVLLTIIFSPILVSAEPKLPILSLGSKGASVYALQYLLENQGYTIRIDGNFSLRTYRTVKLFQTTNQLKSTGTVDSDTWNKLFVILKFGSKNSAVKALQKVFSLKGYSIIVDGYFDNRTQNIVKSFQTSVQIPITGIVDTITWMHLLGDSAVKSSPSPIGSLTNSPTSFPINNQITPTSTPTTIPNSNTNSTPTPITPITTSNSPNSNTSFNLNIPPRKQWENSNGYCGETSIQSIGLYYGAWISQQKARNLANGEVLLGVNAERLMKLLKFKISIWENPPNYQFENYMVWLKSNILKQYPCITAVYLAGNNDPDYDHLMPVSGIITSNTSLEYNPEDSLIFNNLFSLKPITRKFATLPATRSSNPYNLENGGSIPKYYAYGIAVSGFVDNNMVSLPLSLSVNCFEEPNTSLGESPSHLTGTVNISGLITGKNYTLLRFDNYQSVPTTGTALDFINSDFSSKSTFKATQSIYQYNDPQAILSNGITYYRCVETP